MRYILQSLFLLLLAVSCSNKKDTFTVSGTVENGKGKTLYFERLALDRTSLLDSVVLKGKGTFKFKSDSKVNPEFYLLRLSNNQVVTLLADSSECIKIKGSADNWAVDYSVKGSESSQDIHTLNKKLKEVDFKVAGLIKRYETSVKDGNEEQREKLLSQIGESLDGYKKFAGNFILEHPRSFASYFALYQKIQGEYLFNAFNKKDYNYYAALATSYNIYFPESPRTRNLYDFVLSVKKKERMAKLRDMVAKAEPGLPEISMPNAKGDTISLSSLKGKVIILNFWASWDNNSRKYNVALKKLYKKYHKQGLVVYQVSLDKSKILWEDAIEKDKLPWVNVCDFKGHETLARSVYNVQRVPTTYLIDRSQNLIGRDYRFEDLEKEIRKLL